VGGTVSDQLGNVDPVGAQLKLGFDVVLVQVGVERGTVDSAVEHLGRVHDGQRHRLVLGPGGGLHLLLRVVLKEAGDQLVQLPLALRPMSDVRPGALLWRLASLRRTPGHVERRAEGRSERGEAQLEGERGAERDEHQKEEDERDSCRQIEIDR